MSGRLHSERLEELRNLFDEMTKLRHHVITAGAAKFATWRTWITRAEFNASAQNLAHYLALRSHDLRPLQRRLMAFGLSSLGRAEARVLPNLDALITSLGTLADLPADTECQMPSRDEFFLGERILARNVDTIFGAQATARSHILVTLSGEAADDPDFVKNLAHEGADAVRINCAHDDARTWQRMVANVRRAERAEQRKIRILMDMAGPKVRIATVVAEGRSPHIVTGDEVLLCRHSPAAGQSQYLAITCEPKSIFDTLHVGNAVSIDDGKLHGRIIGTRPDCFVLRFDQGRLKGVTLKPDKGINFPGVPLKIDPITRQDRQDLDFICTHADMVGYSFVETGDHIAQLQQELASRRQDWRNLAVVAKIETPRAVRNLPEIIVRAAGQQPLAVMIARGDLGVEMGFTRLAEMQEEILWLCEAAHIPAIWATQVLEDLVKKGLASRGEMTDAAMAGRAECVMLNKGPNVLGAISVLNGLLSRMAEHQIKKTPKLRRLHSWSDEEAKA